jgi:hypothetical protein
MAISRLDIPLLREALDSFYHFLENPDFDLSGVHPPDGWELDPPKWQPDPLPRFLRLHPLREPREWTPPTIWKAFCKCNRGNESIDEALEASWEYLCHALIFVVIARLAPSGFQLGRENPDIADSDLGNDQKVKLQEVLDELLDWRKREALLASQRATTLKFRTLLEDTIRVLQPERTPSPAPGNPAESDSGRGGRQTEAAVPASPKPPPVNPIDLTPPVKTDWAATACAMILRKTNPPKSMAELHTLLKKAGYLGNRSSVYQLSRVAVVAKGVGIYKPKEKKERPRVRGSKSKSGTVEAFTTEDDET